MTGSHETLRSLARRPTVRVAAALAPILGFGAGWLPLLDAPGYELGEAGALLAALVLAPALGIAAARAERAREAPSPLEAWLAASALSLGFLALLLAGNALRAAAGPCRILPGAAAFFPLLAAPSAILGCALAVAASLAARGRRALAAALYAGALLASIAFTLREAWAGPAAFAFDPLLGWWPGPLYDELLQVDRALLLARAEAVAWAALVVALLPALAARLPGAPSAGRVRRTALAAAAVAALAGAGLGLARRGALDPREALAGALGGRLDGPRCTLVFPSEKPAAAAAELLAECEFHAADIARALGVAAPPHVTVYLYRSAEEKRRLVGAAATDYTKPWLAEIHLGDAPLPHPVLRHELVHAVASAIARGPLKVPARAGVLVSAGLVEGLAVALEVPRSAWTVHEWSRAARDLGLLPDVGRLVGPSGFWAEAPARAYTAAGSFLAFLLARHGPAPVAVAYRTGDVAAALGAPLPALVAQWQAFLDGVAVPEGLRIAARARLSRPSLFARRCVREAAALEADASDAAAAGRTVEACRLWGESAALTGSAWARKAVADALARAGQLDRAAAGYRAASASDEADLALRAAVAAAEADLAWRRGDLAAAMTGWWQVLGTRPDRADARLLHAKLVAAADPALGPAALGYLLGLEDPAIALARVARIEHPLAAYLLGRALASRGEAAAAAPELARAAEGGLPALLAAEARMALGEARCASGETGAGAAGLRALLGAPTPDADRQRIEAALRRCDFERGRAEGAAAHAVPAAR